MTVLRRLHPSVLGALRVVAGVAILVAVVLLVGAEPFLRGLRAVSPASVAAALALAAVATAAAAWRWSTLARRLGAPIAWRVAVAAYYRSQLLNSVLPGGVAGDVHRALAHGADSGARAEAARAVVAERVSGQVVQLAAAVVVLVALGIRLDVSPFDVWLTVGIAVTAVAIALTVSRVRRFVRRELGHARIAFASPGVAATVIASSVVVVAAHTATFAIVCAAVGVRAAPGPIVVVSLLSVLAVSIPLGVGGWGPRETVAAWAFAAVGLGAADGVAASTAFGVLATIAVLPGLVVLAAPRLARARDVPAAAPSLSSVPEESR